MVRPETQVHPHPCADADLRLQPVWVYDVVSGQPAGPFGGWVLDHLRNEATLPGGGVATEMVGYQPGYPV